MKQIIHHILIVLLLLMTLTACGLTPKTITKTSDPANVQATDSAELPDGIFAQTVERLLERQDYAEAIRLSYEELRKNPARQVDSLFVKSMNAGLNQADLYVQAESYDSAAELLKTVKDYYPAKNSLQPQLTKTPSQVSESLDICIQNMMEAGLLAYRSDDFQTAMGLWEKIIIIDPQHAAALNSLQTTRMQLSKLKDLNKNN